MSIYKGVGGKMLANIKPLVWEKLIPLKTFLVRHLFAALLQRWVIDQFHRMYVAYPERTFADTNWMGVQIIKCPLDLWIYQEIIHELRPDVIIETGTYAGGSALFLAHLCDLIGNGRILTIDIEANEKRPHHPRIQYIQGNSIHPITLQQVQNALHDNETILVILDSDHEKCHVFDELKLYSPLVSPGSYLIVEDTHVNGHPVRPEHGPGPMEAVTEFLQCSSRFVVDRSKEKYFLTFNRKGFLKCVSG